LIEGSNSNNVVPELIKFIKKNPGCTRQQIMDRFNYSTGPIGRRLLELQKSGVIVVDRDGLKHVYY